MTIQGQGHSLTFVQGYSNSTFSNFSSSKKNTKPFEAKFHMEPPWDVGMKMFSSVPDHVTMMVSRLVWRFYGIGTRVCSNDPGHKTKMAFMSIYDKTFKNLLLWNQEADDLETFGI